MMSKLTVIIPTLNEAAYLPHLLEALNRQTRLPDEIIIADAGSSDGTVAIALQAGCQVVPGGRPARGRNAGAAAAAGDILLFLDADVLPQRNFLESVLAEFTRRRLDSATCPIFPLEGNRLDVIFHKAANVFIKAVSPFNPHAPGFCILVRRQVHENIGGFDEQIYLSEDHDYVRRIAKQGGTFAVLHVPIPVSTRRFNSDGRMNVAIRYSFLAFNQLIGDPFDQALLDHLLGEYRFSHHELASNERSVQTSLWGFPPSGLPRLPDAIQFSRHLPKNPIHSKKSRASKLF